VLKEDYALTEETLPTAHELDFDDDNKKS
jgi:hypothetical protein